MNNNEHTYIISEKEIDRFGKQMIDHIGKRCGKNRAQACVIGLFGNLGAGKTTLVRSILKEMGVLGLVTSPTFVIMKRFIVSQNDLFDVAYHIDAYRITTADLKDLSFKEILLNNRAIICIEWADRIREALPKDMIRVQCNYGQKEDEREFIVD
jgi:tRNA threonylcarbamoyladenosine biosynthesis protein TsaE